MMDEPTTQGPPRYAKRRRTIVVVAALALGALSGLAITKALGLSGGASQSGRRTTAIQSGFTALDGSIAAPSWTLPLLSDPAKRISLAQYRGTPVVLNFWASWCVPCQTEMPAMERVAQLLGSRVAFIGINTADQSSDALAFVAKTGVTYTLAFDPLSTVGSQYGVFGLPVTVFISPAGKMIGRDVGAITQGDLKKLIYQEFKISVGKA